MNLTPLLQNDTLSIPLSAKPGKHRIANFLSINFFIGICSEDEKEFKFYQIKTSEYLNFFI
jgi:hypothetical protein